MMTNARNTDLVEQIAEKHGIEPEALEGALEDLENAERVCQRCGTEHDPEAYVDVRPRTLPDGTAEVLCTDDWADIVATETMLSGKEAETAAYLAAGEEYTNREIASALEISTSNVSQYKRRIQDKLVEAEQQIVEAVKTLNTIDTEAW